MKSQIRVEQGSAFHSFHVLFQHKASSLISDHFTRQCVLCVGGLWLWLIPSPSCLCVFSSCAHVERSDCRFVQWHLQVCSGCERTYFLLLNYWTDILAKLLFVWHLYCCICRSTNGKWWETTV